MSFSDTHFTASLRRLRSLALPLALILVFFGFTSTSSAQVAAQIRSFSANGQQIAASGSLNLPAKKKVKHSPLKLYLTVTGTSGPSESFVKSFKPKAKAISVKFRFNVTTKLHGALTIKTLLKDGNRRLGTGSQRTMTAPPASSSPPPGAGAVSPNNPEQPTAIPDTTITAGPPSLTNSRTPSFSFTSSSATGFECRVDFGPYGPCSSPFVTPTLSDGSHIVDVRAVNLAGVDPSPATRTFTVDGTPPSLTVSSPTDGQVFTTSTVSAQFTAEAGATVVCHLNNNSPNACVSPSLLSGLANGSNSISISATDPAGNSTTVVRLFSVSVQSSSTLCGDITGSRTLSVSESKVYRVTCNVHVLPSASLTIEPGVIVKFDEWQSNFGITVDGTLNADGTVDKPIYFTSITDDAAGGDTNGDGNTAPTYSGMPSTVISILRGGASVSLKHAVIRNKDRCSVSTFTSPTPIGESDLDIRNSDLDGCVYLNGPVTHPILSGNVLRSSIQFYARFGIYNPSPYETPYDITGIDLAGADSNRFVGTGWERNVEFGAVQIPAGESWDVDGQSSAVLLESRGSFYFGISVIGTLNLGPGAIFNASQLGLAVLAGGKVIASGSEQNPVLLTSYKFDSDNEHPDTDSNTSKASTIIRVDKDASVDLNNTVLRNAATAIDVQGSSVVTIRGAILNSVVGVRSDYWVDASNVDWGDPSGPAPIGSGTPVQGSGVFVTPWVGYVPPTIPSSPPPSAPGPSSECKDVLFIGARGSGEAPQGTTPSYNLADETANFSPRVRRIYQKMQSTIATRIPDVSLRPEVRARETRYRALGTEYLFDQNDLRNNLAIALTHPQYWASVWEGAHDIKNALELQKQSCAGTNEKVILSGYSQGALAIHLALTMDNIELSNVIGVALVSDPARKSDGEEVFVGGARVDARGSFALSFPWTEYLPSAVTSSTISLCHNNDIMCAAGAGSWFDQHTNYTDQELDLLGAFVAGRVVD